MQRCLTHQLPYSAVVQYGCRALMRVHVVYSRTAISAFLEICAPNIFNNFRVFNKRARFDSPRLHQFKCFILYPFGRSASPRAQRVPVCEKRSFKL